MSEGEGTATVKTISGNASAGGEIIPTQNISFSNENFIWLFQRAELLKKPLSNLVNDYISEARNNRQLNAQITKDLERETKRIQQLPKVQQQKKK